MSLKERLPPANRNFSLFAQTINHQRVQKPNGTAIYHKLIDLNKRGIEAGEVFHLWEWNIAQLRAFGLLQLGLWQGGTGDHLEM